MSVRKHKSSQRAAVLAVVQSACNHPTADEIYEATRQQIPSISLGTVYRNLAHLVTTGKINRVEQGNEAARFDAVLDPHFHVRCTCCGAIDDVSVSVPSSLIRAARGASSYEIADCTVLFEGLCPSCQQQQKRK